MTLLRTIRYELDMTQGQLANALSTSQAYVSVIERGGSPLSRKMYNKLRVIAAGRGITLPANMADVPVPDTTPAALATEDALTVALQKLASTQLELEIVRSSLSIYQNEVQRLRSELHACEKKG